MTSTTPGPWLIRPPDPELPRRLFCLPYAGSGASSYRRWPRRLGDTEICPVQLPGREGRIRERPHQRFDEFAADAVDGLAKHLDRPYTLFGHCMGALLAYAMVCRIEEVGARLPERLVVSASLVPWRGFFGIYRPDMTDEEITVELERAVAVADGGPLIPELIPMAIRLLRNDMNMCLQYRPDGPHPLPVPVTTIGWEDDPDVGPDDLRQWEDYATTDHHLLAGDTLSFLTGPRRLVDVLAGAVQIPTGTVPSGGNR